MVAVRPLIKQEGYDATGASLFATVTPANTPEGTNLLVLVVMEK